MCWGVGGGKMWVSVGEGEGKLCSGVGRLGEI